MAALPLSSLIQVTPPAEVLPAFSPNVAAFSPNVAAFSPSVAAFSPSVAAFSPNVAAFSPNAATFSPSVYSAGVPFTSQADLTPGGMGYSTPSAHQSILDQVTMGTPTEQAKRLREMQKKWQTAAHFFEEKEKKLTAAALRSEPATASETKDFQDARGSATPSPAVVRSASTKPYTPGEMLAKAVECSVTAELDANSECSTSDSTAATPASPEPVYVSETSNVNSDPKFNLADLPTIGSAGHYIGDCKPCAFFLKKGCENGKTCQFCHLCDAGEKKRRFKAKKAHFNALKEASPVEELMAEELKILV